MKYVYYYLYNIRCLLSLSTQYNLEMHSKFPAFIWTNVTPNVPQNVGMVFIYPNHLT